MTRVHIEIQRVQAWLFAMSRLHALIGADMVLAGVVRIRLPALAREQTSWCPHPAPGVPPPVATDYPLSAHNNRHRPRGTADTSKRPSLSVLPPSRRPQTHSCDKTLPGFRSASRWIT